MSFVGSSEAEDVFVGGGFGTEKSSFPQSLGNQITKVLCSRFDMGKLNIGMGTTSELQVPTLWQKTWKTFCE